MYSMYGGDIITMLILGILVFVIPGTLTVWNIYNCIAEKPKLEKVISTLTVFIGGVFYLGLFALNYEQGGEWYVQVNDMQYHNSISTEYSGIIWIVLLGFVGYFILLYVKADRLPPLISAGSISFLILMNIIQIVFAIQISKNVDGMDCVLYVYHINILILSARAIHRKRQRYLERGCHQTESIKILVEFIR